MVIKNKDVVKVNIDDKVLLGEIKGYEVDAEDVKLYNVDANGEIHRGVKAECIVKRYVEAKARVIKKKVEQEETPEMPDTEGV